MIEIWGKTQCPYCDMAKTLCESKGIEYTYQQLGEDFTREDLMEIFLKLQLLLVWKDLLFIENLSN